MKLSLADPKVAWSTGAGVFAFLVVLPNVSKGWDTLRYVTDAIPAAHAGKAAAEGVRSDFDRYIDEQRQATAADEKVAKALNEYIQQQQQQQLPMNAPAPEVQELREWDAQGCWECFGYSHEDCDRNQRWTRCP